MNSVLCESSAFGEDALQVYFLLVFVCLMDAGADGVEDFTHVRYVHDIRLVSEVSGKFLGTHNIPRHMLFKLRPAGKHDGGKNMALGDFQEFGDCLCMQGILTQWILEGEFFTVEHLGPFLVKL